MFIYRYLLLCLLLLAPMALHAAPSIIASTAFTAADGTRTYMDVGGVWNGTADVSAITGDSFSLTLSNSSLVGTTSAFSLTPSVTLPTNFTALPANTTVTQTGAGCGVTPPTVAATQTGTALAFTFNNGAGYDLPASCALTLHYQVKADAAQVAATVQFTAAWDYALTQAGTLTGIARTTQQNITTRAGASIITLSPKTALAPVGGQLIWTVTVNSTGLGGLFDVTLDNTLVTGMAFNSLVQDAVNGVNRAATANLAGDVLTIPYLAPGEKFVATATTTVNTCGTLEEKVQSVSRLNAVAISDAAAVTLDLKQPLIAVTPVDAAGVTLPNFDQQLLLGATPVTVRLKVDNTGLGNATGVKINTNLNTVPGAVVTVTSPGWSYAGGVFTYTANASGTLASPTGTSTLIYTVAVDNANNAICDTTTNPTTPLDLFGRSYTILFEAGYSDLCGNPYNAPSSVGSYTLPLRPQVTLRVTPNKSRVDLSSTVGIAPNPGETVVYTLSLKVTDVVNVQQNPLIVSYPMPSNMVGNAVIGIVPANTTASCSGFGGICSPGSTLTWSVNQAALAAAANPALTLTTLAPSIGDTPAANVCALAGSSMTSSAFVTVTPKLTTVGKCDLSARYNSSVLMNNNAASGTAEVFYNMGISLAALGVPTPAPIAGTAWSVLQAAGRDGATNNIFEIGNAENGNGTRDVGEGEFIPVVASIAFPIGYGGNWLNSTYVDNFAGIGSSEKLIAGSLYYRLDTGGVAGAWTAVPAARVTTATQLSIDLGFLNAGGAVANQSVYLAYKLSATAMPTANQVNEQSLTQIGTFTIAGGGGGGACVVNAGDGQFKQGDFLRLSEVSSYLKVIMPVSGALPQNTVEVCAPARSLALKGFNRNEQLPQDWLSTLLLSQSTAYSYSPNTAAASGALAAPLVVTETIAANGDIGFAAPAATGIASNAIVTAPIQLKANQAAAVQGGAKPALQAQLRYATGAQHANAPFTTLASITFTPSVARSAKLSVQVSPNNQGVPLPGVAPEWTILVTNNGNGTAYGASLSDTLPAQIVPDPVATNLLNTLANVGIAGAPANYNATVTGQVMSWVLGDIPAGDTRMIKVVGSVNQIGVACVLGSTHPISATWGCGGVNAETVTAVGPVYVIPTGSLQALNDTTFVPPAMCTPSTPMQILVKNTGATHVYNAVVKEILDQGVLSSGLSMLLPGSVTYSADGITFNAAPDPTGAGTAASPYTWTGSKGSFVPLAAALGDMPPGSTIYIKFNVSSANTNAVPIALDATVSGQTVCKVANSSSPASPYTLPLKRPNISVLQSGQNLTTGSVAGSTVYAAKGDQVQWNVTVTNSGNDVAQNVQLMDLLPPANATGWIVSGGGLNAAQVTSSTAKTMANILAGATATYTFTGTLAGTCANESNKADITWGCSVAPAGGRNQVYAPNQSVSGTVGVPNPAIANLITLPDFTGSGISQQFNALPGGRTEVVLTLTNNGAAASSLVLTDTLPAGQVIDTSFAPTVTGSGGVTMAINTVNTAVPVFTVTGAVRHAKNAIITFRTMQSGNFDALSDPLVSPEVAPTTDPALPATANNTVSLSFNNSCAGAATTTATASFDPKTPDLDMTVSPASQIVALGTAYTYKFTLINNGDVGSIADHITFTPAIGVGWATASCKVNATAVANCGAAINTALAAVSLAKGATATVSITATAQATGSLQMQAQVTGTLFKNNNTTTGSNYSLDVTRAKTMGYTQSLLFKSATPAIAVVGKLRIGQQVTFTAKATWLGTDAITAGKIRFKLPVGYGYVSNVVTANNTLATGVATLPIAVSTGVIEFPVSNFTVNPGVNNIFERDIVLRVLNEQSNTSAVNLTLPMGASFAALGSTFASNSAQDGFNGAEALLHSQIVYAIERPQPTLTMQVQNKTAAGAFGNTATGQAGDIFRYKIVLSNPAGAAPLYDIALNDALNNKLTLITTAGTIGADSTANGAVNVNYAGAVAAAGSTILFDQTKVNITTLGSNFTRLDPGKSITLYFEQSAGSTVNPSEPLNSQLTVTAARTLAGGGIGGIAKLGAYDGAAIFTTAATNTTAAPITLNEPLASITRTVTVNPVTVSESLITTSEGNDANANVVIGEQALMRIPLVLPASQSPNLIVRTTLPAGLSLVATPAPTLGANITCANNPAPVTPNVLPAPTAGNTAQSVNWSFGLCTVTAGTAAARSITIDYITQVENIAANTAGKTLLDSSEQFTTDGVSFASIGSQTLTVREPISASTLTMTQINGVNATAGALVKAGDLLTYSILVNNGSTVAVQDGTVVVTLPAGLVYKAGSTAGTSPPVAASSEPNVAGQLLTWGNRNATTPQQIQVANGASKAWVFQATVLDTVQPNQALAVSMTHDWSSLLGIGTALTGATAQGVTGTLRGERDGTTAPLTMNNYKSSASVSNSVINSYSITTVASGGTLGTATSFRVGDLVTYTLTAKLQEGTTNAVTIEDTLPAGLKFTVLSSVTSSWNNAALIPVTKPAANATGKLTWTFGNLTDPADGVTTNDTVVLTYTARVVDLNGITITPLTQSVSDSAILRYQDAAAVAKATPQAQATIALKQPSLSNTLTLKAGQATTVGANAAVNMVFTASNASGLAPAYNGVVTVTLPVGMRVATPTVSSATLGVTAVTLPAVAYNAATGVASWSLGDALSIPAGKDLVLNFTATVDAGIGSGVTLQSSGQVSAYYSQPSAQPTDRRTYAILPLQNVTVTTLSAATISKTVDKATAAIGETLTYTIKVPGTPVNTALYNVNVSDLLPTGLIKGAVTSSNTTAGAPVATDTGTANQVTLAVGTIAPNKQVTITIAAVVANTIANQKGVVISNQGSFTWKKTAAGVTQAAVTSSAVNTTLTEPLLTTTLGTPTLTQSVAGRLQGGDSAKYHIVINNIGDGSAHDGIIRFLADPTLIAPVITANPNNPGVVTKGALIGGKQAWIYQLVTPFLAAATYGFDVTFTLANTVQPLQNLALQAEVDWTSTAGANANERVAPTAAGLPVTGALNDYRAASVTRTLTTGSVSLLQILTPATAAPGETVVYTLDYQLGNNTIKQVHLRELLPAGLTYVSATVSATTATQVGGAQVAILPIAPAAGAIGQLDFPLGDLVGTAVGASVKLAITVRVDNVAGNIQGKALSVAGTAKFQNAAANVVSILANVNPLLTVIEPKMTITMPAPTLVEAAAGSLQAGDTANYKITVNNAGNAPAHESLVRIWADPALGIPVIAAASLNNPGVAAVGALVGGLQSWLYTLPTPMTVAAANYVFDVSFTVGTAVQPGQVLSVSSEVDWTSAAGVLAIGLERVAPAGIGVWDNYRTKATAQTVTVGGAASLTHSVSPVTAAPGETVNYTLNYQFAQGTNKQVHLLEQLPVGMEFVSATLVATNATLVGGGAVVLPVTPAAKAVGLLDFALGDIISTAANPALKLVITARIQNIAANISGKVLTPSATATRLNSAAAVTTTQANANPVVTVTEPKMVLALDGPATLALGTPAAYTVRLDNTGTSAAHQPLIQLQLPAGMRQNAPAAIAMIHRGATALVLNTDYTTLYDAVTGILKIQLLATANAQLAAAAGMDITMNLAVDATLANGAQPAVLATVTSYDSAAGGAATPQQRNYAAALGSGTLGTANGAVADDMSDDAITTGQIPTILMTKSVNTPNPAPGAVLHYQLTLVNSGAAALNAATLTDDMDANIAAGSLVNVVLAGATGTLTSLPTGGANATGLITISNLTIAANATATIDYDVTLPTVMNSGVVISNQATLNMVGFANPKVSDSTNPADNNTIEQGNDPAIANDDDPTLAHVVSNPGLTVSKSGTDVNGGTLLPGDVILYTMAIANNGNEHAIQVSLLDAIPPGTTYVAASTTMNGVAVADVAGTSALVNGLVLQASGGATAAGSLNVGSSATVTLKVMVNAGLGNGAMISNQARLLATGAGSGVQTPVLSDDPSTPATPDPVVMPVGTGAAIYAQMTVIDLNAGAALLPGESVRYTVTPINYAATPVTGVVLTIPAPTNASYTAGTLRYDPDGVGPLPAVLLTDAADADAADFAITKAGNITLTIASLVKGTNPVFTWDATVVPTALTGVMLISQGTMQGIGVSGVQTDMDGNPGNGEQPTTIVVGSAAALSATHIVRDLNGGTVQPGDQLEYLVTIHNRGVAAVNFASVQDAVATLYTTYVPASTRVNGALQADVAAQSPLPAGMALGTIAAGGTVLISYRTTVNAAVAAGTAIDDQATVTGTDAGTAAALTALADSPLNDGIELGNSPSDPNDDDPARVTVGGGANTAAISGVVWKDNSHDRVINVGEPAQASWTVNLLLGGQVIGTQVSDLQGRYRFSGLKPGTGYTISFKHPLSGVEYGTTVTTQPKRLQGAIDGLGAIQNITAGAGELVSNQNLALDPSGVVYDSVTRLPLAGATMTLTGPVGFNPALHLLPGQQGQVTAIDGFYRFDLIGVFPAGVYTIAVVPPAGYVPTMPSALLPPSVGPFTPPLFPVPFPVVASNAPPAAGTAAIYYMSFNLAPGANGVINNHIAVDPLLSNAIAITKTTPKQNAVVGDLVPYVITMTNTLAARLTNLDLIDSLPPGFKYVPGSAQLDGVPLEPLLNGHSLTWKNLAFTANSTRVLKLLTIVGAGVGEGNYVNKAWMNNPLAAFQVSNLATATVTIIPDAVMSCSDVIGQVFYDHNANGYQDSGDEGVPAVRVVTTRGLLITTDDHGRYHVPCADTPRLSYGSNFIVKLDKRTLPGHDYVVTSENPRVVRLSRGKMVQANFGVSRLQLLTLTLNSAAFKRDSAVLQQAAVDQVKPLTARLLAHPSRLLVRYERGRREDESLILRRLEVVVSGLNDALDASGERAIVEIKREVITAGREK